MKRITNWRRATVCDSEANSLLDDATLLWVVGFKLHNKELRCLEGTQGDRIKAFLQYHIDNKIPLVCHNAIGFDIPLFEKLLGMDLSELMVICTLALSWYLNTDRKQHGLDTFLHDYGIPKVVVKDKEWVGIGASKESILTFYEGGEFLGGLDLEVHRQRPKASQEEEYLCILQEKAEHQKLMNYRVQEDVKINIAMWEDFKGRLVDMYTKSKVLIDSGDVGGKRMHPKEVIYLDRFVGTTSVDQWIDRILTFLMFKMDCVRIKEKTMWEVDVPKLQELHNKLETHINEAKGILESILPPVPQYVKKNYPKKPTRKAKGGGEELSASGHSWNDALAGIGIKNDLGDFLTKKVEGDPNVVLVLSKYNPPNANSSDQIKRLLYKHGWVPETFEFADDKEAIEEWEAIGRKGKKPKPRMIPQISKKGENGKELCPSVVKLAEFIPEIMEYQKYTTIKNRLDTCKGWFRNLVDGKYLRAGCGGLTNTLREQHRVVVNLPGVDKPYGAEMRGCFIAGEGKVSLGSDLSSLEDRSKHHFMLPHDPEYVNTMMADDYDPHLLTAYSAGMMTEEQFVGYKKNTLSDAIKAVVAKIRKAGKECLPIDTTEILTIDGWKKYGEVSIGDAVIGLDTVSGETLPCRVLDTVDFEDAQTIMINSRSWKLESTENHRWYVRHRTGRGGTRRTESKYKTTKELKSDMNIISSAPFVGGNSIITPNEASVIAWILSDGYLRVSESSGKTSQGNDSRRQGFKCSIAQSNKKFLTNIEYLLKVVGIKYGKHLNSKSKDVYILNLCSGDVRNLWDRANLPRESKNDCDFTKFILSLSKEALKSFLDSFIEGDGQTSERYKELNRKTEIIYQNKGGILDAVHLCSELLGRNTTVSYYEGRGLLRSKESGNIGLQKVSKGAGRRTNVFCLTTELGNFIVKQGGFITITGNCNYASVYGAGPPTIARAAGVSEQQGKELHTGYWKLNWSVNAIADEQVVIKDKKGGMWLINPINGFCYSLRAEKDRFSTLCQGTGSFFFDMWVDGILNKMKSLYNKKLLNCLVHDEMVISFVDTKINRKNMIDIVNKSLEDVNEKYLLRRKLGCDIQFGDNYAEIH